MEDMKIDNADLEAAKTVAAEAAGAVIDAAVEGEVEVVEIEKTPEQLAREAEAEEKARKAKKAAIWDKITTGLLIFLLSSPILILLYILIWFLCA